LHEIWVEPEGGLREGSAYRRFGRVPEGDLREVPRGKENIYICVYINV